MSTHSIYTIDLIVVHHSASDPAKTTFYDVEEWHLDRGWGSIGYHRVIGADGMVWDGRPLQKRGAHAPPNANRLGICVVGWNGNGEHPEWAWSSRQWAVLEDQLDYWSRRYPEAKICGHNQTKGTLCPGLDLVAELNQRQFVFANRLLEGRLTG